VYPVVKQDREIAVLSDTSMEPVDLFGQLRSGGSLRLRGLLSARRQVATVLYARFSFPSPGIRGFLYGPIDSWHLSKMLFSAREHLASHWLDLAEGRLRLDRLNRNGGGETFFP